MDPSKSKRREIKEDVHTKLWPLHTGHTLTDLHLSLMSSSYKRQVLDCRSSPLFLCTEGSQDQPVENGKFGQLFT